MTSVTLENHVRGENRKDSGTRSQKPLLPFMISAPSANSVEFLILVKANIGCFQAEGCPSQICVLENSRNIEKGA